MNNFLIETIEPNSGNLITETVKDANGNKRFCLKGVFMQADIKNRNGRVYPLSEISNAVSNAANSIKMHGGIFGELDHPQTLTINMDRISHVIKELSMNGVNAVGKAELLDTPMGQIAKTLAESGARYGVSSRGTGDVDDGGNVKNFMFLTCDLVVTPSAPGAMPDPLYESLQQEARGRKVLTLAESVREDAQAQQYLKKELLKFFDGLIK
jgi:hypothetical protein